VPDYHDTENHADDSVDEVRRRWPDLVTLTIGIATLFVAAFVLSDGTTWLPVFDARWVLAGGATLVGLVLLLGGSFRGKVRRRRR
jgi:hypothetical protein